MEKQITAEFWRRSIVWVVPAGAILIAGCGSFQLAGGIHPPPGKSNQEQQTDVLVCKDQARIEASTAERQAGAFALGFTIVGAPLAYELDKAKQREVFAQCMSARGYAVAPVVEGTNRPEAPPTQNPSRVSTPPPPVQPSPPNASTRELTRQFEKLQDLKDRGLITDDEFRQKRKDILDRL